MKPRFQDPPPDALPMPDLNPYVREHLDFGPEVLSATQARDHAHHWDGLFGRTAPLHLEIGSGNGFYLSGMAALHPEADWLGIEIRYKRVVIAARKLRAGALGNARIARFDGWAIAELFAPGSLAGIHINHPDPWPRRSQEHRRLIGPPLAEQAAQLLAFGGEVRLKTDFAPHVEALLAAIAGLPFLVAGRSEDVRRHGAPWPDEVRTNYQRKFDERGLPVHALWLTRTPA